MRLNDYYSRLVRDGRRGRPSMREAREDYARRNAQFDAYLRFR